jgi:hypothetical protein
VDLSRCRDRPWDRQSEARVHQARLVVRRSGHRSVGQGRHAEQSEDDPTREEMLNIHEEQLKKVQELLKKANAEDAAAKKNN